VVASLAAIKRTEHAALNQSQNTLQHAQTFHARRFPTQEPTPLNPHTGSGHARVHTNTHKITGRTRPTLTGESSACSHNRKSVIKNLGPLGSCPSLSIDVATFYFASFARNELDQKMSCRVAIFAYSQCVPCENVVSCRDIYLEHSVCPVKISQVIRHRNDTDRNLGHGPHHPQHKEWISSLLIAASTEAAVDSPKLY
jgi:hypothetical protein